MRLSASSCMLLCVLVAGCGSQNGDPGAAAPTTTPAASESESSQSPSAAPSTLSPEERAEKRAARRKKREAREARLCAPFLSDVSLTYEITATPTDRGQEIGLRMTLDNRSDTRLSGASGGELRVAPGRRQHRIAWGGSSADTIYQGPRSYTERDVWHERQPPGWRPVGERVTSFQFYAYTFAPKNLTCDIPAMIVAPPGLVDGHPAGRWTQQPSD